MESLALTKKLTSKRSRNDFAANAASVTLLAASRTVELPEPKSKIIERHEANFDERLM